MTATLNWIPNPDNTSEQIVQYRLAGASSWNTFGSPLPPTANSVEIPSQLNDRVYEYQILSTCTSGGNAQSTIVSKAYLTCPIVTLVQNATSISYSFPSAGGDITMYQVDLLNAGNALLQSKQHNLPLSPTLNGTFVGLTPSTNYSLRVSVHIGDNCVYCRTCDLIPANTTVAETCSPVTGLTVTISA